MGRSEMHTYMKKSPVYYAVSIQGFEDKYGWYLCDETEDELIEFAKMVNADWSWNMRTGVLSFKDKSEGVKLNRPERVKIGDVVVAYNDWEKWRVDVWTSEEFEKKFIKVVDNPQEM
jgi:hypothetical protein